MTYFLHESYLPVYKPNYVSKQVNNCILYYKLNA